MPTQCEHSGCTANAAVMSMVRPAQLEQPGPVTMSKRCEAHKYEKPEGSVSVILGVLGA